MQPLIVVTETKQILSTCSVGITAFRPGKQYQQCGCHGVKGLIDTTIPSPIRGWWKKFYLLISWKDWSYF